MSWTISAAALASLFIAANLGIYHHVAPLAVCYIILMLTYRARHVDLDQFGDISYGVYIYAWPVQQLVYWKGQSALTNAVMASVIVCAMAYASWRYVEEPALRLKKVMPLKIRIRSSLQKAAH